jgi:hypothetical protein
MNETCPTCQEGLISYVGSEKVEGVSFMDKYACNVCDHKDTIVFHYNPETNAYQENEPK